MTARTPKQIRKLVAARIGLDWRKRYKIKTRRHAGRCQVVIVRRPRSERVPGERHVIASARSWREAARQVHP